MKKIFYVFLLIAVVFAACKDNQENTTPSNPAISSVVPSTAMANQVVSIKGKRFSNKVSENIVKFLGVNAEVLTASDTLLTVVVPAEGSTGTVTITVGNKTSKGPIFTYGIADEEEEEEYDYVTSTYAGTGVAGGDVGPIASDLAKFSTPNGVAIDPTTGDLIVTNRGTHSISRVTKAGIVTRIAGGTSGNVDGALSAARFNGPYKSVVDKLGNIYVADFANHKIRKIDLSTNTVSTLAGSGAAGFSDGQGSAAKFSSPAGVAVDDNLNVYVADAANHAIRKISPTGKVITLVGGVGDGIVDGFWPYSSVSRPTDLCMGKDGFLYSADRYGQRIRKINVNTGEIITIAGTGGSKNNAGAVLDGEVMKARFDNPWGIDIDKEGTIYVSELGYSADAANTIRMIKNGKVTTIGGDAKDLPGSLVNGIQGVSRFKNPSDIAVDNDGVIYVGDQSNQVIRKIVKVPRNP